MSVHFHSHLSLLLLICSRVPVHQDLERYDAVDDAAAHVSQNHNLVSSLLDGGEDPGNGAKGEQENCDGRELPSVPVFEVGHNLDDFTCRQDKLEDITKQNV